MRLAKIDFVGLQQRTKEEAVAASGLQSGQDIDISILDAAAQRLMDSGLFKKLSYRYRTVGDEATVTFQVEEDQSAASPVVFDNFVWFSDEELATAVRRQVPTFDGTAPDTAVDGITRALQQLLAEKKIDARVEYTPSGSLSSKKQEHIFSVDGINIRVCALSFPGASGVGNEELVSKSAPVLTDEYRRSFISAFARENLIPVYRERGYLRAAFQAPIAILQSESEGKCKGGVSVTLPVVEGSVYSWEKAEWTGNAAVSAEQLEKALAMKTSELANGLKIDKGINEAGEVYLKQGYLGLKIKPEPVFDDATNRVTYRISLEEGPQYRMGTLTISGLSESEIKRLNARWKLKLGDVYDGTYLKEFLKKDLRDELRASGSTPKKIDTSVQADREKLTVDVVIAFKK
jgi:outer membrane protein assembly factor BamA